MGEAEKNIGGASAPLNSHLPTPLLANSTNTVIVNCELFITGVLCNCKSSITVLRSIGVKKLYMPMSFLYTIVQLRSKAR